MNTDKVLKLILLKPI